MSNVAEPRGAPDRAADPPPQPVATIEIDRFCDGCGYNLRTQPVRRDPQTQILIVRCPECGKFASATDAATSARPWLHRVVTVLLGFWMFFMLWIAFLLCLAQGGITMMTLESRTTWVATGALPTPPALPQVTVTQPDGSTVVLPLPKVAAATTAPAAPAVSTAAPARTRRISQRVVRAPADNDNYLLVFAMALSCFLGFVLIGGVTVAMYHWPRWTYLFPAILVPLVIGLLVGIGWTDEAPRLVDWGTKYIVGHAACYVFGALLAIAFGRAMARLIIMLLLPPRPRAALAFLWLADGKTPPMVMKTD